jgi:hypothetical protein
VPNETFKCVVVTNTTGRVAVSTDDRKIKFYDIHTWEVVMEVELQNPALCMCSWKHLDTEMFGENLLKNFYFTNTYMEYI